MRVVGGQLAAGTIPFRKHSLVPLAANKRIEAL